MKLEDNKIKIVKEYIYQKHYCGTCLQLDISNVILPDYVEYVCPKCNEKGSIYVDITYPVVYK